MRFSIWKKPVDTLYSCRLCSSVPLRMALKNMYSFLTSARVGHPEREELGSKAKEKITNKQRQPQLEDDVKCYLFRKWRMALNSTASIASNAASSGSHRYAVCLYCCCVYRHYQAPFTTRSIQIFYFICFYTFVCSFLLSVVAVCTLMIAVSWIDGESERNAKKRENKREKQRDCGSRQK